MQAKRLVNGPKGQGGWNGVNWRRANRRVRNLRQRIFRASQQGNFKKMRSLQRLMLRSYSNVLVSVRRVTQLNKGKNTPGVDKLVVKTPRARWKLVQRLRRYQPWRAKPLRRVYIPKSGGRRRPLGIPVIAGRALQAVTKNALEPEWEAIFERISYGFRLGRSCHDAIARIFCIARCYGRKMWALDADIRAAFDEISHSVLLAQLGYFPGRELVKQWLKAGVMEDGEWQATELGVPQGGVISPVLLNVALHGMEQALGIRYNSQGGIHRDCKRAVVRYADDFVVFTETKQDAVEAKKELGAWLAERGLSFSPQKTRIVHLREGFDFLGFNVRHYRTTRTDQPRGWKLFIKPSEKSIQRFKVKLKGLWLSLRGHNERYVLAKLNPVIRGWTNYYRIGVSKQVFSDLDAWMFGRLRRWVKSTHPRKNWEWLKNRYFGKLHPRRKDRWVFGEKKTGRFLLKLAWTPIQRHVLVKGRASPDDPSLRMYWAKRRKKRLCELSSAKRKLARRQDGLCPVCGVALLNGEELHKHHVVARKAGGDESAENLRIVHLYCHQQIHAKRRARARRRAQCAETPKRTPNQPQQLQLWNEDAMLGEAMQFA